MNMTTLFSKPLMRAAAIACAGLLAAGVAQARSNPVDPISNPNALKYSDVHMTIPKYDEPFQRDGIVQRPEIFRQISAGMTGGAVQGLIGAPIRQERGARGTEWDYHFKFVMPQSSNYLVCQYKVVFDEAQQVREAVWRRHQCADIVAAAN